MASDNSATFGSAGVNPFGMSYMCSLACDMRLDRLDEAAGSHNNCEYE